MNIQKNNSNIGNKYTADKVEAGGKDNAGALTHSLIKGIPVLHKIFFSENSDLASSISVLFIEIDAEARDDSGTEFRDIEI